MRFRVWIGVVITLVISARADHAAAQPAAAYDDILISSGLDDEGDLGRVVMFIESLDSTLAAERELATSRLLREHSFEMRQAEALLRSGALSSEARNRIESVARDRFSGGPWAGMGIRMALSGQRATIQETIPGFPAYDVLEPGDVILEADGLKVEHNADLRASILSHDAYGTMRAQVERNGETIDLRIPLGSYGSLNNMGGPAEEDLNAAWARRRFREDTVRPSFSVAPPSASGEPAADPAFDEEMMFEIAIIAEQVPPDALSWMRNSDLSSPAVVAGGEPVGGVDSAGRIKLYVMGMDVALAPVRTVIETVWMDEERARWDPGFVDPAMGGGGTASMLVEYAVDLHRQLLEVEQIIALRALADFDPVDSGDSLLRQALELRVDAIDEAIREVDRTSSRDAVLP